MATFKIEYGEKRFRVVAPNDEYEEAVSYCSVSTVEYLGRVYAAYLNGEEKEFDPGADVPNQLVASPRATVYDITDGLQNAKPMPTVTENVDFEEDAEADEDFVEDVIDVEPV